MIEFCSAKTRAGKRCQFSARKVTGLCVNHDPTYKEQQAENVRRGATRSVEVRAIPPLELAGIDIGTRAGIQAAIETVIRLELAGRLSERRTRNIIRALSMAVRNTATVNHWSDNFHHPRFIDARQRALSTIEPVLAEAALRDAESGEPK